MPFTTPEKPLMQEIELKFQIPSERVAGVRRAVATKTAQQTRLQAQYFDTADRLLARSGFAVRLRREGKQWVQTLKGRGDGLMARLEHNAPLDDGADDAPVLDLDRHAGTPAGAALQQLLARAGLGPGDLRLQYRTDILRTHRLLRHAGARIELALDEGEILGPEERRLAVSELEFELVEGAASALLDLARRWVARHHLWLDVRTKAERGDRLARGLICGAPVRAQPLALDASLAPQTAVSAMLANVLRQILPNAADVAEALGQAEHVHQLRVGLRRLRSVLHEFGDAWRAPDQVDTAARVADAAAQVFSALGVTRDRDALLVSVLPQVQAAGGPPLVFKGPDEGGDPAGLLRSIPTQILWLDILRLSLASADSAGEADGVMVEGNDPAGSAPALKPWVRSRLDALHRRLVKDAECFETLPLVDQHRTRKRLKRLRYGLELTADLHPRKALQTYLQRLQAAQEELGHMNDLCVAEALYERMLPQEPRAWFALGWLCAQRRRAVHRCARTLRKLARTPVGWRRGPSHGR